MLYIATGFNELEIKEIENIKGFCYITKNNIQKTKRIDDVFIMTYIENKKLCILYPKGKKFSKDFDKINFIIK